MKRIAVGLLISFILLSGLIHAQETEKNKTPDLPSYGKLSERLYNAIENEPEKSFTIIIITNAPITEEEKLIITGGVENVIDFKEYRAVVIANGVQIRNLNYGWIEEMDLNVIMEASQDYSIYIISVIIVIVLILAIFLIKRK